MMDHPSSEKKDKMTETPTPEVLRPQTDDGSSAPEAAAATTPHASLQRRHTYRPSHKATFIGLAVVVVILAVNAGIIFFVMQSQTTAGTGLNQGQVTLSSGVLDKLGVSRNPVGNSSEELVIGPNSHFNGKVTVGSDVSIAGQLTLNSKFSASDARLGKSAGWRDFN